jgi:acetyl-CoA carboxylase biotin carboxyl carrier protein
MMNLDQLRQILSLVREHELTELEIEQDGLRLKIRKDAPAAIPGAVVLPPAAHLAPAAPPAAPVTPAVSPAAAETAPPADAEIELAVVKSPIVGTFYRSPEPGAAPFVEVGGLVKKGQVLCIIEAMKLMNEIDSEYEGEIVNIYVESGHPVQYGERLFAIRTR